MAFYFVKIYLFYLHFKIDTEFSETLKKSVETQTGSMEEVLLHLALVSKVALPSTMQPDVLMASPGKNKTRNQFKC